MKTRENLAWAAGLFEGEGCISSWIGGDKKSPKTRKFLASLEMTDFDTVKKFQQIIGFGKTHKRPGRKEGEKPQLVWRVNNFEHMQALVGLLWFGLGKRRKKKAKEILTAARTYFGEHPRRGIRR